MGYPVKDNVATKLTAFNILMTCSVELQLNNNIFSGVIESELGACTNLKLLYLDQNFLHGNLSSSLGNLHKLGKSMMDTYVDEELAVTTAKAISQQIIFILLTRRKTANFWQ